MATRVQTAVQIAFGRVFGRQRAGPGGPAISGPGGRLSYLWLALGIVLYAFVWPRWTIPLAAWLYPIFWLRFTRTQPLWRGILLLVLASALVLVVVLQGVLIASGVFYFLDILPIAVVGIVPYLLDRVFARRLGGLPGTLVFPLALTGVSYIVAVVGPTGTMFNQAYTQYGDLPLLQLVSVTGLWGIIFLMSWLASVVNWAWEQDFAWPRVRSGVLLYAGLLALVFMGGGARLAFFAPQGANVRVAGVTAQHYQQLLPSANFGALLDEKTTATQRQAARPVLAQVDANLLAQSQQEAAAGAKIVAWPESGAAVLQEDEAAFLRQAQAVAKSSGIYLDMGLAVILPSQAPPYGRDESVLIDPSGKIVWTYQKAHPVPGEEDLRLAPGNGQISVAATPYGRLATAVCLDRDFLDIIGRVGQSNADILLVPGGDWRAIDPYHSQMAAFEAIESGSTIVNPTSYGVSVAVDYEGHVLGATDFFTVDPQVVVAYVPTRGVHTIYATIGDLFAWLSIAGLMGLIGAVVIRRRMAPASGGAADSSTGPVSRPDLSRFLRDHPISGYFVLAYVGTWIVLLPAVLSRDGIGALPFHLPFVLFAVEFILAGLAGPTLAAFIMTGVTLGRPGVRAFLRRYVLWRVGPQWYLAVLFGQMAVYLLIAVLALGSDSIHGLATKWPLIFTSYLPLVLTFNLSTAIGEEPGWRGYALPRLQERYGPLPASVILGTLHAGWHLPVFLLPAIGLGPLSLSFLATWIPALWGTTILWTWIFNNAKSSILIAVLMHSAYDAAGAYVFGTIINVNVLSAAAGERVAIVEATVFVALATLVLALTRGRLSYEPVPALQPVPLTN